MTGVQGVAIEMLSVVPLSKEVMEMMSSAVMLVPTKSGVGMAKMLSTVEEEMTSFTVKIMTTFFMAKLATIDWMVAKVKMF